MKNLKRLFVGASVAIVLEASATTLASAATLGPQEIVFDTANINTWLYKDPTNPTYEVVQGVSRKSLNDFNNQGNVAKAIQALTDENRETNVELWTSAETITANVGFSAKLGKNTVRVESVTLADWSNNNGQLAKSWLNGFLTAYDSVLLPEWKSLIPSKYDEMLTALTTKGLYSSGDPNIGSLSFDTDTNELKADLVGHLDRAGLYIDTRPTVTDTRRNINGKPNPNYGKPMSNPTYLKPKYDARYATGSKVLDDVIAAIAAVSVQQGKYFQMSEIAKITFNDQLDYAFAFAATDSGAIAGDRNKTTDSTSHTGIYTWTKKFQSPPTSVPEPGTIFGTLAVAGLAYRIRRKGVVSK
ncbi:MAG: NF038130 family PEP-CTERM protein [Myxacorys californica WJT36-NPBG1]|jgi:hypothetical protein|nr:NF038130 family PEP-CTERM protein [Myxacorys californica WJT36-NPBG1]